MAGVNVRAVGIGGASGEQGAYKIQVEGLDELKKALRAAGVRVTDLNKALRAGAKLVADEAQSRAPVGKLRDDHHKPGSLRRSIKPKASRGNRSQVVLDIVYGGVQEFGGMVPKRGNKGQGRDARSHRHNMKATGAGTLVKVFDRSGYFLHPAMRDKRDEVVKFLNEEIQQIVDKHFIAGRT